MNKNLQGEKLHRHIVWRREWKRWLIGQLLGAGQLVLDVMRLIFRLNRKEPLVYEFSTAVRIEWGAFGTTGQAAIKATDRALQYEDTLAAMTKYVVACGHQTIVLTYPGFESIALSCCPAYLTDFTAFAQPQRGQWYLCYRNALGGNALRNVGDKAQWTLEDMVEWLEYDHLIQRKTAPLPDYGLWLQDVPQHAPMERQFTGEPRFLAVVDKFDALERFSSSWMESEGSEEAEDDAECSSSRPRDKSPPRETSSVSNSNG